MSQIIRSYLEENGLIKNVIAYKCGMDEQKFYRIIGGSQKMTVEDYENICIKGLGVDPGYFFKKKFSESKKTA